MTYEHIRSAKKIMIGTNQTTKALEQSIAKEVVIAKDADKRVISHILTLCKQQELPVSWVDSMKQLGKACNIEVGAATVAIVEH